VDQSEQRDKLREFYYTSWEKHRQQKEKLSPLEQQIVTIIKEHPEYHKILEDKDACLSATYLPEMGDTNPFLHLGMHIGLREQVLTDRPTGIAELYQRLATLKGVHEAEGPVSRFHHLQISPRVVPSPPHLRRIGRGSFHISN